MDHIVGVMYCKNEVDVLPLTIPEAMKRVDSMFISDDGSIDGSWELIQYFKARYPGKIEYIQQKPKADDAGQRSDLLNEIRRRYKPENTWVQVVEADIVIQGGDLRKTIADHNVGNVCVKWENINVVRDYWDGIHQFYPYWPENLGKIMDKFHWIERLLYTYRPLPELYFTPEWRPWPRGFSHYITAATSEPPRTVDSVPLLCHYGYRGPTHLVTKWARMAVKPLGPMRKYGHDFTSIESVMKTFCYFNGKYNRNDRVRDNPTDAWLANR